jgi:hypothetical protein
LEHEEASFFSAITFWLLLLILGTAFNVGSAYMPMANVLFPLLARSIVKRLQKLIGVTKEVALALSHALGLIVPLFLFAQVGVVVLYFFTPLMGRAGTLVNIDGTTLFSLISSSPPHLLNCLGPFFRCPVIQSLVC